MIRAILTSESSKGTKEGKILKKDRDQMLRKLVDDGLLQPAYEAIGPDEKPLLGMVRAELQGDLMRIRGSAHLMHVMEVIK
jgi:hypothetical protein